MMDELLLFLLLPLLQLLPLLLQLTVSSRSCCCGRLSLGENCEKFPPNCKAAAPSGSLSTAPWGPLIWAPSAPLGVHLGGALSRWRRQDAAREPPPFRLSLPSSLAAALATLFGHCCASGHRLEAALQRVLSSAEAPFCAQQLPPASAPPLRRSRAPQLKSRKQSRSTGGPQIWAGSAQSVQLCSSSSCVQQELKL